MKATATRVAVLACAAVATAAGYEGPRTFQASEVLTPAQIKGPHFVVQPEVPTEGYFHVFQLKTDFGAIEAEGRGMLQMRELETKAIAQLSEVSKSDVFLKAAGTSVANVGKGVAAAASDPEATAKGVGSGVKKFGTNLGRKTKRAADQTAEAVKGDDKPQEGASKSTTEKAAETGTGIASSALGVNRGARKWAQKAGFCAIILDPPLARIALSASSISGPSALTIGRGHHLGIPWGVRKVGVRELRLDTTGHNDSDQGEKRAHGSQP